MDGRCEICGCEDELTIHHLVPKLKCKNRYRNLKNDECNFALVCRTCHDQIHAMFSELELRDGLNTVESLVGNERFAKYVEWRKKHIRFKGHSKMRKYSR